MESTEGLIMYGRFKGTKYSALPEKYCLVAWNSLKVDIKRNRLTENEKTFYNFLKNKYEN